MPRSAAYQRGSSRHAPVQANLSAGSLLTRAPFGEGTYTMSGFSIPLTRLVHENLSVIMRYAYSQAPLAKMVETKFEGEWKYLNKDLFELSAERAEKACLELALFLRTLDEDEGISAYHAATRNIPNCGKLIMKDGTEKPLPFREFANKVIHASRFEWEVFGESEPRLICHTRDKEKWLRADIDLVTLSSVCGGLMS